ncbi:MAG TPA: anti-sigma factor, partial [Solirubrobacteraceae bacterium]|nr:anti-sigma factor [Solirubrobacteraceae bacterium]
PTRPQAPARKQAAAAPADGDRRRSSMLGGALLIGGLAILLALLVVWLVTRDGDDGDRAATDPSPTATATATPTATVQPLGQIELRGTDEAPRARGTVTIYVGQGNAVGFTVEGRNVPQLPEGQAYAVWLTGGDRPRRLGYAPPVGENGQLGTTGPREEDAERFPRWLSSARNVVVSRETNADARQPGPIVLSGSVRQADGG